MELSGQNRVVDNRKLSFTGLTMSAVIGGTADPEICREGGGKPVRPGRGGFANGAVTGAYVMMFNHLQEVVQKRKVPGLDFYYRAVDGMELPDGTIISKDDIVFTFVDDPTFNASYGGLKEGKHHINLNIGDYEVTSDNVRALVVHEVYGHGIMGYDTNTNHHLAYFSSVDSKYWDGTTLRFKQHVVNQMWIRYYYEVGNQRMPQPYQSNFDKYQTLYD